MPEELNEPQTQYGLVPKQKEEESKAKDKRVSLDEYLEMIADGERRLEYHDGQVIDIQSATEQHGQIGANLAGLIYNYLRGKDCRNYIADREVWIEACKKMFYPDLLIVCGEQEFKQMSKNVKATINPSVVIEILSDSTSNYDKKFKSKCYKKLESIKQIIYVAQDEKYIYIETPTDNKRVWLTTDYFEDDDLVLIGECNILLKDIYEHVEFDNQPERATEV